MKYERLSFAHFVLLLIYSMLKTWDNCIEMPYMIRFFLIKSDLICFSSCFNKKISNILLCSLRILNHNNSFISGFEEIFAVSFLIKA